jgi:hypothetical protein
MMKALIQETRVCQIEAQPFEVHSDLVWVDCDDTITDRHTYVDGAFVDPPEWATSYKWDKLRDTRDSFLMGSDWTQVSDAPVDADAWATYRQTLRDLPANTADPANPSWPTKPGS